MQNHEMEPTPTRPAFPVGTDSHIQGFQEPHEVTRLLDAWAGGDRGAFDRVIPLVLRELHQLAASFMARQGPGHTLQPTALVHEAWLRLVGRRPMPWESRTQFFAYMATTMRRLLVNHARDRTVAKRAGGAVRVDFEVALAVPERGSPGRATDGPAEVDLLDLDAALAGLAAVDARQARIVELRYFGGLTVEETGGTLGISSRTVKREWRSARLWLLRTLAG